MGRKHSKRRNTLRKVVKRRNTKRRNTKRRNTKRRNTNKLVKHKGKIINGYKIIKRLNYHKSSIKYGGVTCKSVLEDYSINGFTCNKRENIGQGNYGSVYLVKKRGVLYAMKIMDFNGKAIRKSLFSKEVSYLEKLRGIGNIVQYIEHRLTEDGNHGILIMNYLGNDSLAKLIEDDSLGEIYMWKYIIQLSIALNELHRINLFHNDIKTDNIMIYEDDAYLIDLGLMTEGISACRGSPYIMPYEKIKCARDTRCRQPRHICNNQHDIYSIAMVMFEFINIYDDDEGNHQTNLKDYLNRKGYFDLENKDELIILSLKYTNRYNVSEDYKLFIINIINGTINTPEDILLNLPKDILLQLGDIYLSKLYDTLDASLIEILRTIIINDNKSRETLIAEKKSLMVEIRDSDEGLSTKLNNIREIEETLRERCYLEKLFRNFLENKVRELGTGQTDTVKSILKNIVVALDLERDLIGAPPVETAPLGEPPPVEEVEELEEVEEVEEGWKVFLQTEYDLFL